MSDLSFDVKLRWSGTGREGGEMIEADDLALELSSPKSMGGLGVRTNPEELLVCAVSSCYTVTLFGVLRRAELPVNLVAASASGTVTGLPGHGRFGRILVSPTILGGDPARQLEYEGAAGIARQRCLIGRANTSQVAYEVGSVHVPPGAALAVVPDSSAAPGREWTPRRGCLPPRARGGRSSGSPLVWSDRIHPAAESCVHRVSRGIIDT